jgi:hypothetical protein
MSEEKQFRPISTFSWEINRAERSHQVNWLAPLLDHPEGRVWFLEQLECPCTPEQARIADVFHLCFPLRDIFTEDYHRCRVKPDLERQFIAYYNRLFGLPEDFGVQEVWLTAPGGGLRHPAAGGQAGWHENFLRERVPDDDLCTCARNVRRMLGTEADVLILTASHVTLVECKFKGKPSTGQYRRQQMMGKTLASRLGKEFYFGMVVEEARDPRFVRLHVPYALWSDIQIKLTEITGA